MGIAAGHGLEGYEQIPTWVMQAMTLAIESWQQLEERRTSADASDFAGGVGSFAGSIMGYFIERMKRRPPPSSSSSRAKQNCLYRSAMIDDGQPHSVGGDMATLMAGLSLW
jgi:diaminopropionate ammonia-lyase